MRNAITFGIGFVSALLLAAVLRPTPTALAKPPTALEQTMAQFTQGLSQANQADVQASTTAAFWKRLEPSFKVTPAPAAGAFGTFQVVGVGRVRADLGVGYVTCTHADGVTDYTSVTLRLVNNAWKVCGGPMTATGAKPLG